MILDEAVTAANPIRIPVALDTATMTLVCRKPSFDELTSDRAYANEMFMVDGPGHQRAYRNQFALRCSVVTDWEGVTTPDNEPIKFTPEKFYTLMGRYPALVSLISQQLSKVFLVGESIASNASSQNGSTANESV